MRSLYFALKRRVMTVRCFFGIHNHKMGVPANDGGAFGCLWCRKSNATVTEMTSPLKDPIAEEATRRTRNLFGGKA